jgi:sugar/nucleoside kinase (ribokinase family)
MDFVTFALIIDDLVFPDGRTEMGVLGGGGPQAAFGMRLWAERVGLVGGVGADLPAAALEWLAAGGIDIAGLRFSPEFPTPRAWQLLEADGRRTQVWRIPGPAIAAQLGWRWDRLPLEYRQAQGYHLGVHPEAPDLDFIRHLQNTGAVVSIEPFRAPTHNLIKAELRALVSAGHIFSPNQAEAVALVGPGEPLELVERLAAAGAEIVALRQGSQGATVYRADSGETWHIPALETTVVDPTGAGDAFCGGFLVGWVQTGELRLAGLYGSVAASFLVEQVGLPQPRPEIREEARRRLAMIASRTRQLEF